jgi:hypothetical protein
LTEGRNKKQFILRGRIYELSLPKFQMFKQHRRQFTYYRHQPVIQGFSMTLPLIMFSFDLWRYLSGSGPSIIGMVKKRFRNKAQALADDLVREVIVENPKLTREGTDFLSKLFTNNQTTSSLSHLLLNVL